MKFVQRLVFVFLTTVICYNASAQPYIEYPPTLQKFFVGRNYSYSPSPPYKVGGTFPGGYNPRSMEFVAPDVTFDGKYFVLSTMHAYTFYNRILYKSANHGSTVVVAGNGESASVDGTGADARFRNITGMALDNDLNVYLAETNEIDSRDCRIRKITSFGVVSTFTKNLNGVGAFAIGSDKVLYCFNNDGLLKIDQNGVVSVIVKSLPAIDGNKEEIIGMAVDKLGNVYLADKAHKRIIKVTTERTVFTFAGSDAGDKDGIGLSAKFSDIGSIGFDSKGSLWVSDKGNGKLKKVSADGLVTTISKGRIYTNTNQPTTEDLPSVFCINPYDFISYFSNGAYKQLNTYGYSIDEALPDGMVLNTDGSIGGTPTKVTPAKEYTISASTPYGIAKGKITIEVIADGLQATVTSFTPVKAPGQATVTITGTNFTGATRVMFGVIDAESFQVISPTEIKAVTAATGGSGLVSVSTPWGGNFKAGFIYMSPPVLRAPPKQPIRAGIGSALPIEGINMTDAQVTVAGIPAQINVKSDTYLEIVVPNGATSGDIKVTTPYGSAIFSTLDLVPAPEITSLSPTAAGYGEHVTITGKNFDDVSSISLGGVYVKKFTKVSSTVIDVEVGEGKSGDVRIWTIGGKAEKAGFTYKGAEVYSFAPTSAGIGQTVTLKGAGFMGVTKVTFGDFDAASFTVVSDNEIKAVIGQGEGGEISVTGINGANHFGYFSHSGPSITSSVFRSGAFSPNVLSIRGTHFGGTTSVTIGGVPVSSFNVLDDSAIDAYLSPNTISGDLLVTTPLGISKTRFIWEEPPVITSVSPLTGKEGDRITVRGRNLTTITHVTIGGNRAKNNSVTSDTTMTFLLGVNPFGTIIFNNFGGSTPYKGFNLSAPVVTSITPAKGGTGTEISVAGTNLSTATVVKIGNIPVEIISKTDNLLKIKAAGEASGVITVQTGGGDVTYGNFQWMAPPIITSFERPIPQRFVFYYKITGKNFSEATAVSIGGQAASSFSVSADDVILAYKADGVTTDQITVTTPYGISNVAGLPQITSVLPLKGKKGDKLTVKGSNFSTTTFVTVGGGYPESFKVISDTEIEIILDVNSPGDIVVNTTAGSASFGPFVNEDPFSAVVTNVFPESAGTGETIQLFGHNFVDITSVKLGGTPVASYTVESPTSIIAVVGNGSSGQITLATSRYTSTSGWFDYKALPVITKVTPLKAAVGKPIYIYGSNFYNAQVTVGGVPATVTYNDVTGQIIIKLNTGTTSGELKVTTAVGSATFGNIEVVPQPQITSFTPVTAGLGETVVITGNNLTGVNNVSFGDASALSFVIKSATTIEARVGYGNSGKVTVKSIAGIDSLAGFTHKAPVTVSMPSITKFTPNFGGPTSTTPVIITGSNFQNITGVTFGGVPAASYRVNSPTEISAVPANATSGDVEVLSSRANAKLSGFIWAQPPVITSFNPVAQKSGGLVTIYGSNFIGVTAVKFEGVPAQSYTVVSPTQITAHVGLGASGLLTVSTIAGTATSSPSVGFSYKSPRIISVAPEEAPVGQTVIIKGENLLNIKQVKFGGANAASFNVIDEWTIKAVLGAGSDGSVTASTTDETSTYTGFKYIYPPSISHITPEKGVDGTDVTIWGANLATTTEVRIGNKPVEIRIKADGYVGIKASGGAEGAVYVRTKAGEATKANFTSLGPPTVTSISPGISNVMDTITITGTYLKGVTAVLFGDNKPAYFKEVSKTQLKVVNKNGGTGSITIKTQDGTTTFQGYTLKPPPQITSFTASAEGAGAVVTIIGRNFNDVSAVKFGGTAARSFTVNSSEKITAVVGDGASGAIAVVALEGTGTLPGYLYAYPPYISSFSPIKGIAGAVITISGDNFNTTPDKNIVYFGPVKAFVKSATKNKLEVLVPNGAGNKIMVIDADKHLSAYAGVDFYITKRAPTGWFQKRLEIDLPVEAFDRLSVGDFDSDGKVDLVISGGNDVTVFQNQGGALSTSMFSKKFSASTNLSARYGTVVGDVNGDGLPDILFGSGNNLALLRNTTIGGNVSFEREMFSGILESDDIALTDVDMDGKTDVYMGREFSANIGSAFTPNFVRSAYLQKSPSTTYPNGPTVITGTVADIDGDAKPEYVSMDYDRDINIWHNKTVPGSLSISGFERSVLNPADKPYAVEYMSLNDFDGDGKKDFYLIDRSATPKTYFFINKSKLGFADTSSFSAPKVVTWGYRFNIVDVDADGKPDFVKNDGNNVVAYLNESRRADIQFNSLGITYKGTTTSTYSAFHSYDIDGDGTPEFLMVDASKKKLTVMYNDPLPVPEITSISPKTAHKGDTVTITGKNFYSPTVTVSFGSVQHAGFHVISDNVIKAIVGNGETGDVSVETGGGVATQAGFVFLTDEVVKIKPVITFPAVANTTYGNGDIELNATSTNTGVSLKYVVDKPDVATIVDNKIHILKAGVITVTASQVGDSLYYAADAVTQTLTIAKAVLTLIPDNISRQAGEPNPLLKGTAKGFVNNESTNNLIKAPVWTTTATAASPAGLYDIVGSGGEADNYDFVYTIGKLNVLLNKAVITFPAIAARRYGDADIELAATSNNAGVPLTYSIDNPDVATVVNSKIHILKAGSVKVTASQEGNGFYEPAESVQQTIIINKATLVITADDKTKVAGKPNPAFTLTYSGFVNGETSLILTQQPVVTTTATTTNPPGLYDIVASGAVAANYDITYNNGKLTVTKDKPVISFPAIAAHRYGDADIELAATSTNAGVPLTYSTDKPDVATVVNNKIHILKAGSVKVTASQVGNSFYEPAESVQQTLLIDKVALVVTAEDKTRAVGKPDPSFTVTYQGFVKGETSAALGLPPVITTTATALSAAGVYNIVPSGAVSDNYNVTYNNGKLTITPALDNLKVSATDVTCKGQANGIIAIVAKQTASYTAVLTGNSINKSYTFTVNLNIDNLSPGTYNVCVSDAALPGQKRCFDLTIIEPKDLSVYAAVVKNTSLLNISLAGGNEYQVTLNGRMYSTRNNNITLELNRGSNKLEVATDKDCQGKVEQIINYSGNPVPYPNPFSNELFVNVGVDDVNATIKIYSVADGSLKLSEQFKNVSGVIKLDVSKLKMGVYSIHVNKGNSESVYKVIKQ